jgi:hypothetical protein
VQRNRHYGVETFVERQGARQQIGQRSGQSFHASVFKNVDQLPQHAFVRPEAIRRIEPAQSAATESAAAVGVQRERIDKGCSAIDTKELRAQRFELGQAAGANRDAADGVQATAANTAIVGE